MIITAETQPRGVATETVATKKRFLQADSDTKKKKVTNKHHQRDVDQKKQVPDHEHG